MDNWEIYYRTHAKGVGKVLTGLPPLTFVSNGEPLADYRIYGNSGGVGDRTKNLFDPNAEYISGKYYTVAGEEEDSTNGYNGYFADYVAVQPNTAYILSDFSPNNVKNVCGIYYYTNSKEWISRTSSIKPNTQSGILIFRITTPPNCYYIRFQLGYDYYNYNVQFEEGSTATAYEPYGYKIPIVCGGTTTNIYIDEPLNEVENISMSDTGISIPTINGTNILTVDTAVQQSKMYIEYGGSSNVNQSLMKYLEYKYKFAKE